MTLDLGNRAPVSAGPKQPWVIGLTGPIASGKSTVAALLERFGAEVIDADLVYRALLTPGSDLQNEIVTRFGPSVLGGDGEIDRQALGAMVFHDQKCLADLERLTHPPVVAEIRRMIGDSMADVIVVEAVKLSRAGLLADVNRVWFITADEEHRVLRLRTRNRLSSEDARARLAGSSAVLPPAAKLDVIIKNSGDLSFLFSAVAHAWRDTFDQVCGIGQVLPSVP